MAAARPGSARRPAPGAARVPAREEADFEARRARDEELRREALEQVDAPDPAVRADAAERLGVTPESFSSLAALLRDPSADVRAAAATTLGEAFNQPEEREALDLLLRALHDPAPEVVLAALEGLQFLGDAHVAPELRFLLAHASPEVRDAARESLQWLAD